MQTVSDLRIGQLINVVAELLYKLIELTAFWVLREAQVTIEVGLYCLLPDSLL
ncbi:MAG: hypothetical protein A4E49_00400 [Methanosaeta sp. PtaU1.Bin112]|nr:MAG: hypothetical protein A4E49_00400 [Methanosaeta sp. PtaU1.Bin112]